MQSRMRAGFTLIELMVAMALTLFIMVILSEIFVISMETFVGMKGIGDMQINLRVAENLLRDDLSQAHFQGKTRLSDLSYAGTSQIAAQPPSEGFFAVRQFTPAQAPSLVIPNPPYALEGADVNGLPSYRAVDHILYFTVRRKGNRKENFFTTDLTDPNGVSTVLDAFFQQKTAYNVDPLTVMPHISLTQPYTPGSLPPIAFYASQWAEVVYFLVPSGTTEEANNLAATLGTPTFKLYRVQFVMVPDATNLNNAFTTTGNPAFASYQPNDFFALSLGTFRYLSCKPNLAGTGLTFYSPADAARRLRVVDDLASFNPAADPRFQPPISTLVLPNVISFQVQIMPVGQQSVNFVDVPGGLYDTTLLNQGGYTNNFGLKAAQITLRVWDPKTRQTRQVSIVQDL